MTSDRLDLTDLEPAYSQEPYEFLAAIRAEEPVRRVVYHGLPTWLITRYADAEAAFGDVRLSSDKAYGDDDARSVPWIVGHDAIGLSRIMVHKDPPDHTRLRRLVSKAFTPRRIEQQRPFIEQLVSQLLDDITPRGTADVLHDFSLPLAARVIMTLIGVPHENSAEFQRMSSLYLSTDPAEQEARIGALLWIRDYVYALIDAKRESAGDDLLSSLIGAREGGDRLDEDELRSMAMILLMAGHETTASLIGSGLLALLRFPDQLKMLEADRSLIPAAVEEMLRFDGGASAALPRYAREDLTIGGTAISKDDAVIISLCAADRDPARFSQPDVFDIQRRDGDRAAHLAFGRGIHVCLGAPLARLEAQIAFAQILARWHDIKLAVPESELHWRVTPNIRGLSSLPVTFSSRS
jgi:cytochrome P450